MGGAGGTVGVAGEFTPLAKNFDRSVNPISTEGGGADNAVTL